MKDLPSFVTRKWIEIHDQAGGKEYYRINKEIRIKISFLGSDLCDFSDAYIVVKRTITVTEPNEVKRNDYVAFKNNAPFTNYISKVNGVQIGNAVDLDVVMPMYNMLKCSKNYRKTTGS